MKDTVFITWNPLEKKKSKVLGQGKIKIWEKNHGLSNNPFQEEKKVMGINYSWWRIHKYVLCYEYENI